jgi:hypothetical protein
MYLKAIGAGSIVLCLCGCAVAQSVSTLMSARANALGNASSCLSDEWSLFNNVGGLANVEDPRLAISYAKNAAMPEGDRMAAAVTVPLRYGTLGAGFFRFGDRLYNEQLFSAGFSNQFGLASLGIRLNVVQYNAEGFGTRSVVALSFGGIASLTPAIRIGAHIINVNQPIVSSDTNERLPTILVAGIAWIPNETIFITGEVEKDLEYKPIWKAGFEYKVFKRVTFSTGFDLSPVAAFFGVGFQSSRMNLFYALEYSAISGTSHQVSVSYSPPKK